MRNYEWRSLGIMFGAQQATILGGDAPANLTGYLTLRPSPHAILIETQTTAAQLMPRVGIIWEIFQQPDGTGMATCAIASFLMTQEIGKLRAPGRYGTSSPMEHRNLHARMGHIRMGGDYGSAGYRRACR